MSSTWISMPIENAKEVAQRYMRSNLAGATNAVLSYDPDCEVYLTSRDLQIFSFDSSKCYVGYVYCGGASGNEETALIFGLEDNATNSIITLDAQAYSIPTTMYPVIWNGLNTPVKETVFIGYRFNVTY